jgi:carbon-monoxide dehydrogenase large subunit
MATDVPPVDGFYQEVRATTNPLGLRGLGECGNPGLGGAIANAVCDALAPGESSVTALPLTPARVFLAVAGGAVNRHAITHRA